MRVILDTNIVISGIFFGGIPRKIIEYGQKGLFTNVISHEILNEYTEIVKRTTERYKIAYAEKILDSIIAVSDLTLSIQLKEPICKDPKDDKFIAAAIAGKVKTIVSGDKHLKAISGWGGINVVSPKAFLEDIIQTQE